MTLAIVAIVIFGYLLVATSNISNINRAAAAMFVGTLGWIIYVCYGTDFVMSEHSYHYHEFLDGDSPTSVAVKHYIADNIFLMYVGRAAEVVLFLLATMTIVEILNNNGCFDFLVKWLRTRSSVKLLWMLSAVTFLISANLDNLTTTMMMLVMMHQLINSHRQRVIYGFAIVLSANIGGALTVIGNPEGLVLWNMGAVTATNFSLSLLLPLLIAWAVPLAMLSRKLPERLDVQWVVMPYRGDDTNLNYWQRIMMLVVGIGGLWFIPTFHNITKLSPFLGALCVLSILWIVNEVVNRKLIHSDMMVQRREPIILQHGTIKLMLFVIGIILSVGVLKESGALEDFATWCELNIHNIWVLGIVAGLISTVLDTFATAMNFFWLYPVTDAFDVSQSVMPLYTENFMQNGNYWKVIAYTTAIGGTILTAGSMSGTAFAVMERLSGASYFMKFGVKVLIGGLLGYAALYIQMEII